MAAFFDMNAAGEILKELYRPQRIARLVNGGREDREALIRDSIERLQYWRKRRDASWIDSYKRSIAAEQTALYRLRGLGTRRRRYRPRNEECSCCGRYHRREDHEDT